MKRAWWPGSTTAPEKDANVRTSENAYAVQAADELSIDISTLGGGEGGTAGGGGGGGEAGGGGEGGGG